MQFEIRNKKPLIREFPADWLLWLRWNKHVVFSTVVRIMSSYSYHAFACLQLDRFNILPRCMTTSLQHWVSTSFRLRRHRHVRRALTNRQDRACVLLSRNLLRFSLIPTFHFVTGRARVKLTFMCAQPTSALWRHTKNHVTGVN